MLRTLHSVPGLIAALLLALVTLTGSVLAVFPAWEHAQSKGAPRIDAATLAGRVSAQVPGVETLVRQPSGSLVAYHMVGPDQRASVVDPATGAPVATYRPSGVQRWVKNLHRKLLLDDAGRAVVGMAAACMLFVVVAGLLLLVRRMGGWKQMLGPVRGNTLQRLHNQTARVVFVALALSATTGVLMSMVTFGLVPEGGSVEPFPDVRPGSKTPLPLADLPALQSVPLTRLRQLKLPAPGDPTDVIEVETTDGTGVVDPSTGDWLSYTPLDGWQRLHATVRMLHTGDGLWWLALLLGAASLTVPLLGVTGTLLWWRRRQSQPRLRGNASAQDADTIVLVGSEGNATWGFAAALHEALTHAGLHVHTAPMNDFAGRYRSARHLLVLTATYGDGEAPESARYFLDKLARAPTPSGASFAVLGFGDRQFPRFCGYAHKVHDAMSTKGYLALGKPGEVDRQSEPEFLQWCEWLGTTLGVALDIRYTPARPHTMPLTLVSRADYGADAQMLTAVLRFGPAVPARRSAFRRNSGLPRFEVGDLLGVVPPGGGAPRFYSLASAAADGVIEICVRRMPHGLCSSYLTSLQPGASIQAFVRPHQSFRPSPGLEPVILVGAGTGIGPLIGFIRHNVPHRPMHLYFGARNADDGFLYGDELQGLVGDRRLRSLTTAFSRSPDKAYVQDRLLQDAAQLRGLVAQGAQILVCGGRKMADGVADAWERILAGSGVTVSRLRAAGRYVEDVY